MVDKTGGFLTMFVKMIPYSDQYWCTIPYTNPREYVCNIKGRVLDLRGEGGMAGSTLFEGLNK